MFSQGISLNTSEVDGREPFGDFSKFLKITSGTGTV